MTGKRRLGWIGGLRVAAIAVSVACCAVGRTVAQDTPTTDRSAANAVVNDEAMVTPWDYKPYRVLIWFLSDDPTFDVAAIEPPLLDSLDRDFAAVWRITMEPAPPAITAIGMRDMGDLDYPSITAADPTLAVKRDHPEAARIRTSATVAQYVKQINVSESMVRNVAARVSGSNGADAKVGHEDRFADVTRRFNPMAGDSFSVASTWADPATEAVLVSRGLAATLEEPAAKLIPPTIPGLVTQRVEEFDKVFFVRVAANRPIAVVEMDVLMRYFSPVFRRPAPGRVDPVTAISDGLTATFGPVVRIEDAGRTRATGLLRGGGLVLNDRSPANVRIGDVLTPMVRKNDRGGKPFAIGPLDWSYLIAVEDEEDEDSGRYLPMKLYSGRGGGLQGRKNDRTFRMAIKTRVFDDQTTLRLHARDNVDEPLIGYEIYERQLESKAMSFVGRTNWDGRLSIERMPDRDFRLLYVKNGGAVLARLPMVPGHRSRAVADLTGDDDRLQAEAYIRGVQNAIVDLVAIRELFRARIRMRLNDGEMDQAQELMSALRDQPTNQVLSDDMDRRQAAFLDKITNSSQRRKVDQMFTTTRDLLGKHINPKLIRDLENDFIKATNNGGKLPPEPER